MVTPLILNLVFEEEKIFGYKDLKIKIYYGAGSLVTYFAVEYSAQVTIENTRAEEINSKITPMLDPGYYDNFDSFMHQVKNDQLCFKPMGIKVGEYALNDCKFELYQNNLTTPRFKDYHRRLQLFLIWFIEGSSYIEEDDDKWEIILMYLHKN